MNNYFTRFLFVLIPLVLLLQRSSFGGILDTNLSTDTSRFLFFLPGAMNQGSINEIPFITTPDAFHNYDPNMQLFGTFVADQRISLFPYYGSIHSNYTLGNFGTPANSELFFHRNYLLENRITLGANLVRNSFGSYLFDASRMRNYKVRSPLTELYYVGGDKKEQIFQILHTQNINPQINMGVEYRSCSSEGFYQRQETKFENFRAFLSAESKNKRYSIVAHSIWNNINANENGGILADSLFEKGENITKSTIPVKLLDANSQGSNQSYFLKQQYVIGSSVAKTIDDSTMAKIFLPKHRLSHTLSYQSWSNYFIDNNPDTSNYVLFIDNINYTSNHIYSDKLENRLGWLTLADTSGNGTVLYTGIIHELNRYKQDEIDSNFNNLIYSGILGNNSQEQFHWKLSGGYGLYGGNQGNYKAAVHIDLKDDGLKNQFNVDLGTESRSPSLFQTVYSGNHYQWNNNFLNTQSDYLQLSYMVKKHLFSLSFIAAQVKNFIYNNEFALPDQSLNVLNVISGVLVKDFKWNNIGMRNTIVYQRLSDTTVLHLPSIISYHALYFEGWIFKRALFLQMGFDVLFNTTYYADNYMPSSGLFYLQANKEIGDYPYLNFFINFKVNQARVFFKIDHLNQGYLGNTYYSAPHYPMADRAFKLGISWLFYD